MLSAILDKKDCAACRFCCSFRRVSMWEVPIFTSENLDAIRQNHPDYMKELKIFFYDGLEYAAYDLSAKYRSDDPEEEAPCPFLDPSSGCVLSGEEKPWDCKIWPLRIVKPAEGEPFVSLTPTCPVINSLGLNAVRKFVNPSLEADLLLYAKEHPYLYKTVRDMYLNNKLSVE